MQPRNGIYYSTPSLGLGQWYLLVLGYYIESDTTVDIAVCGGAALSMANAEGGYENWQELNAFVLFMAGFVGCYNGQNHLLYY